MTLEWPPYDYLQILMALMFVAGLAAGLFAFRMWKSIVHERRLRAGPRSERHAVLDAGLRPQR